MTCVSRAGGEESMTHIRFNCDRCGAPVEGIHTYFATAGFYEECIWSMPEYQAEYGQRAPGVGPHPGTGEAEAR
jgi:hypothetical protein